MAIDFNNIITKFIEIASEITYNPPLATNPESSLKAILRARQNQPKEDYPYMVIDILDVTQENGYITDDTLVDDNDNTIYQTNYQILILFRVYGAGSLPIINQLETYFRIDDVLGRINLETGGNVVETQPISSLPTQLADRWEESAAFNLVFNITDSNVYDESIIETIDLGGKLFRDEDDPDPLDMDISVTSQP